MKIGIQPRSNTTAVRLEVEAWRSEHRLSKEAVGFMVEEAHAAMGADKVSDLHFESKSTDAYQRMKVAGQKVSRWLEAMPLDALQSVLAPLPFDRQLAVLNEIVRPLGMVVHGADQAAEGVTFDAAKHASSLVREDSEAVVALITAGANPTASQLKVALKELGDVRESAALAEREIIACLGEMEPHNFALHAVA